MNESFTNYIFICAVSALVGGALAWIVKSNSSKANPYLEEENANLNLKISSLDNENRELLQEKARLETELLSERKRIEEVKEEMTNRFKAISSEVSQQSQKSFLELAEETFKRLQEGAKKDQESHGAEMKNLVNPVKENLENLQKVINEIEKTRAGSFSEISKSISFMREDSEKLRNITTTLAQTLSSTKTRGRWGEIHLQRALESVGMTEGVDFVQQNVTSDAQRPDFTIYLPENRSIIIDSKVPLDAYMRANSENVKEEDKKRELKSHADAVRSHIKQLSSKAYWENLDNSPEFVLMYLPNDSFYAAALEQDPTLFEEGTDRKVFIMTPSTLMPTLFVIKHAWKQEKLAQNAKEISSLGQELYKRLCTFSGHFDKIRKGLDGAVEGYNNAASSLEGRVMVTARKFRDLQAIAENDDLSQPSLIEKSAKHLLIEDKAE